MGLDPTLLADAYETLKQGSEIGSGAAGKAAATGSGGRKTKKNYLNKELMKQRFCISGEIQNLRFITLEFLTVKAGDLMLNR